MIIYIQTAIIIISLSYFANCIVSRLRFIIECLIALSEALKKDIEINQMYVNQQKEIMEKMFKELEKEKNK